MKFYYSRNNRSKINNFNVYTGKKVSVLEINNELEKSGFNKFKIIKRNIDISKIISKQIYKG